MDTVDTISDPTWPCKVSALSTILLLRNWFLSCFGLFFLLFFFVVVFFSFKPFWLPWQPIKLKGEHKNQITGTGLLKERFHKNLVKMSAIIEQQMALFQFSHYKSMVTSKLPWQAKLIAHFDKKNKNKTKL